MAHGVSAPARAAHTPHPLVIVLDEFQYLGEDSRDLSAVTSELNAAWEQRRAPRPLVLVLSGSAVRVLEALDSGGAPLHGRFVWKGELRPFDYWHASEMANFRNPRDRIRAYGIFGGTPRYLAAIKPSRSMAENAARLMLSPRGEVRGLVETAAISASAGPCRIDTASPIRHSRSTMSLSALTRPL